MFIIFTFFFLCSLAETQSEMIHALLKVPLFLVYSLFFRKLHGTKVQTLTKINVISARSVIIMMTVCQENQHV